MKKATDLNTRFPKHVYADLADYTRRRLSGTFSWVVQWTGEVLNWACAVWRTGEELGWGCVGPGRHPMQGCSSSTNGRDIEEPNGELAAASGSSRRVSGLVIPILSSSYFPKILHSCIRNLLETLRNYCLLLWVWFSKAIRSGVLFVSTYFIP